MKAHRVDATVSADGSITVRNVPFVEGEEVEVIVLPRVPKIEIGADRQPLRGSVGRFERPFESAADANEWDAA